MRVGGGGVSTASLAIGRQTLVASVSYSLFLRRMYQGLINLCQCSRRLLRTTLNTFSHAARVIRRIAH